MKNYIPRSFFLAGTIQGSRQGTGQINQDYRDRLQSIISKHYPEAEVFCPLRHLHCLFTESADATRDAYTEMAKSPTLIRSEYSDTVARLTTAFAALCRRAALVDVLVAYLPDHEASMGTAMEMWNAFNAGSTVVTISPMRQNLAILSTSSIMVPTLEAFDDLLEWRWLDDVDNHPRGQRLSTSEQLVKAIS